MHAICRMRIFVIRWGLRISTHDRACLGSGAMIMNSIIFCKKFKSRKPSVFSKQNHSTSNGSEFTAQSNVSYVKFAREQRASTPLKRDGTKIVRKRRHRFRTSILFERWASVRVCAWLECGVSVCENIAHINLRIPALWQFPKGLYLEINAARLFRRNYL